MLKKTLFITSLLLLPLSAMAQDAGAREWIPGYTTSDGTQVDGYYKETSPDLVPETQLDPPPVDTEWEPLPETPLGVEEDTLESPMNDDSTWRQNAPDTDIQPKSSVLSTNSQESRDTVNARNAFKADTKDQCMASVKRDKTLLEKLQKSWKTPYDFCTCVATQSTTTTPEAARNLCD
jgi:hypothetical protein